MKKKHTVVIFTDLDGSLLHRDTFQFDSIKDYIKRLVNQGVIIIPNSSKTEKEIEKFNEELGVNLPFISENGSSIHGLNLITSNFPDKLILSREKKELLKIFENKVPEKLKEKCFQISKMSKKEQENILGQKDLKLKDALNRKYTLPFLFNSIFWVHASDIGLINYPNAMEHAPAGVMGDHNHKKGEWMFSYRHMFMQMHDNRISGRKITDSEIATSQPNRFASVIGQPSNLRVIPKSMTMEMHMFGGMYAPSDFVTVMILTNYSKKQMDHTTFRVGSGNNKLGEFETRTSGIGDLQISSLLQIYNRDNFNLNKG